MNLRLLAVGLSLGLTFALPGATRTFMTYNIYECRGNDAAGHSKTNFPGKYERSIGDIARVIRAVRPDWVALQEVDRKTIDKVDQAARIAEAAGIPHVSYFKAFKHRGGEWGVALLSHEKPLATRSFPIEGRVVGVVEFTNHVVYVTHLGLKVPEQLRQIAIINAELAKETKPVIFTGDMNIRPNSKPFPALTEKFTWLTSSIGRTWPSVNPTMLCDYFFVDTAHRDAFRTVRAWDIAEPTASDHRPVAIILEDR